MHKPISVYSHDSDPAIDRPSFHITPSDAAARIARGYVRWLSPRSVQLKPPPGYYRELLIEFVGMRDAWQPRSSVGFIVLQMRTPGQEKSPA